MRKAGTGSAKKRRGAERVDMRGVRDALIACLKCIHGEYSNWTLTQVLVVLEVLVAEDQGRAHTVFSVAAQLGVPQSTMSRVVWTLSDKGGDDIISYQEHPTDRRKKVLIINPEIKRLFKGHALKGAMLEYYGTSVYRLEPTLRASEDS